MDACTRIDSKAELRSGFDSFSPENLAANEPIVVLPGGKRLSRTSWQKIISPKLSFNFGNYCV